MLSKTLISHDAGWYNPGEKQGGSFRGYTYIFRELIPLLKKRGFSGASINQLLIENPENAFAMRVRKYN